LNDRATVIDGTKVSVVVPISACDTTSGDDNLIGAYQARPKGAGGYIVGTFRDTGPVGPS
jgi:hypothetical protein